MFFAYSTLIEIAYKTDPTIRHLIWIILKILLRYRHSDKQPNFRFSSRFHGREEKSKVNPAGLEFSMLF